MDCIRTHTGRLFDQYKSHQCPDGRGINDDIVASKFHEKAANSSPCTMWPNLRLGPPSFRRIVTLHTRNIFGEFAE